MHRHKLRPVMEKIAEDERKGREAEIEGLEEDLRAQWRVRDVGEGRVDDGVGKTETRCYVEQTEWMDITMASKGQGFW